MCLLGLQKLTMTFNPCLEPRNVDFWQKTDLENFDRKSLTMGALESKLALIIIVAL